MDNMNANRETMIREAKEWQSELNESLARARKSGENDIVSALESHGKALQVLLGFLEGNSQKFQKDFWSNDSSDTKVNQIIDQVIAHVSMLSLPAISKRAGKKEADIARRGN